MITSPRSSPTSGRPPRRPRRAGRLPGPRRLHPLLRLHPHEHAADAQPEGALVAGQRRQRQRRPPPPPRLRDRDDDGRRHARLRSPSATAPTPRSAPSSSASAPGLTIDEFALWVYLEDVYWAEEGRSSIDATVIAAAAMMLVLLGFNPFELEHRLGERGDRQRHRRRCSSSVWSRSASSRGGSCTGSIGFFFFPIAIYGACRIGKPRLGLGAAPLRRAAAEEAGEGRSALPARPPHRPLQGRLPRHRRRQAERGRRRRPRRGDRGDPRGERRNAPARRTRRPPERRHLRRLIT